MPGISFSGLASGLDTGSIVDQLVALERAPIRQLETRKRQTSTQISTVSDLVSKLTALKEKGDALKEPSDIRAFKATSTDEAAVKVASSGSAQPGVYNVRVQQLARGETTVSDAFASDSAGIAGSGSFTLTMGNGEEVSIDYDSSHSLSGIATLINDSGAPVAASVLFDGSQYQLMVSSTATGSDAAISFGASSLGLEKAANEKVAAQNAVIELNGITVSRASNTMSDVLAGVTLTVAKQTAATDPPAVVTVASDAGAVKDKLQSFVDAYNGVVDLLNRELSYTGTAKGQESLFSDSTLQGLQRTLRSQFTEQMSHNGGSIRLGDIGFKLDNVGRMSLDATKLEEVLANDSEAIENAFSGENSDGITYKFAGLVDSYTRAGDGFLSTKKKSLEGRIKGFDSQIERVEVRAGDLQERLSRQFSALESMMIELQNQGNYLASMFAR